MRIGARFQRQMSTHCCFRRFAPILRCTDAAGVARVPKLGQPPQTLDAARAHLDQSSAQLLVPTRADLAKPTDATLLRANSHSTSSHDANEPMLARKRERKDANPSRTLVAQDGESLSLEPGAHASSPADFRQIGQSSARETAPDPRKPFPYAMAVNSNFIKKTCNPLPCG